jgi:hypothetical protein
MSMVDDLALPSPFGQHPNYKLQALIYEPDDVPSKFNFFLGCNKPI